MAKGKDKERKLKTQDLLDTFMPNPIQADEKGRRIMQTHENSKGGRPVAMEGELERLHCKIQAETAQALRVAVAERKLGKTQSEIVDAALRAFLEL